MATSTNKPDPVELLRELTADAIQERLLSVEAEADALRVLLRSARARERRDERKQREHPSD